MAAELRQRYPGVEIRLVGAAGGLFEVSVDGTLVFSKQARGRHANPGEVVELIERHRSSAP